MVILEHYYNKIIKLDLINKYSYKTVNEIPKLKKIVLNFGCKNSELFDISSTLLFLELITFQSATITKSKKSNVLLKIRKGNIVGCTVVLTKEKMYNFLFRLLVNVIPNFKDFDGIKVIRKKLSKNVFSFTIKDFACFKELEKQFYLFTKLVPLNITFITNTKTEKELFYLLQAFKLPIVLIKNK